MQCMFACMHACRIMASKACTGTGNPKEPASGDKPGLGPASDQKQKKRCDQFQRVPSSKRCGTCHTCLHPRLKKACLTIRAQQERQLKQGKRKEDSTAEHTASGSAASTSVSHSLDRKNWKPQGHQRAWMVHGWVRNDGHVRVTHGLAAGSMHEDSACVATPYPVPLPCTSQHIGTVVCMAAAPAT